MAWSSVAAIIDFWSSSSSPPVTWTTSPSGPVTDVPSGEKADILGYLQAMYAGSAEARGLLDGAVSAGARIRIGHASGSFGFSATGGGVDPYVGYDMATTATLVYFNDKGVLVTEKPQLTVIHELIHNLRGTSDPSGSEAAQNGASFDFKGDTVRAQNTVAQQMGFTDNIQASYGAAFSNSSYEATHLAAGVSYTNGAQIDIARVGDAGANSLNMAARTDNSRDLLFGLGGNDSLHGGGGDDFLYGGQGADTLEGGEGADLLYGGEDADQLHGGQGGDLIYAGEHGVTPGTGDAASKDQLWGDAGDDTLWGGGGDDTLDGGDDADQLNGGEGKDKLVGGDGNDTLNGSDGNDLLVGNDGDDQLIGGDGADILMPGAGVANMSGGAGNDWFWLDRGVSGALDLATDYTISNGESGDRLFWNGYALEGGQFTVVDEITDASGTTAFGSYLGDHGIIYDYNPLFTDLLIVLPTNEILVITGFTNGMFGLTFDVPPDPGDWDGVPRSNIAGNGDWFDFENLSGRSEALGSPGPEPTPTAPLPDAMPRMMRMEAISVANDEEGVSAFTLSQSVGTTHDFLVA